MFYVMPLHKIEKLLLSSPKGCDLARVQIRPVKVMQRKPLVMKWPGGSCPDCGLPSKSYSYYSVVKQKNKQRLSRDQVGLLLAKMRKRRQTILNKIDEFHESSSADIYLLIHVNGKFYQYIASQNPLWPPTQTQVVSSTLLHGFARRL
ncbi:hypothetical protein GE09DRAFT_465350 [Coniochaeta sp. 2T2.1]|nr:hypothetical protein GE09DRAFT_465350 [Coniochaeta sp. 2T2.1]